MGTPRYSLLVKGTMDVALDQIKSRGFNLVYAHKVGTGEVVAIVNDTTYSDLQTWFNEALFFDPPYPEGTLLHFTSVHRKLGDD